MASRFFKLRANCRIARYYIKFPCPWSSAEPRCG
jgi:hypothetical protein